MAVYADELKVGDFVEMDGSVIHLAKVNVNEEIGLVFAFGMDLLRDRVTILPPFDLANYVEIWNA
jgi:hypothetical protein